MVHETPLQLHVVQIEEKGVVMEGVSADKVVEELTEEVQYPFFLQAVHHSPGIHIIILQESPP